MGIPEGSVQWDVKIEQPNLEGFKKRTRQSSKSNQKVNTEIEVEIVNNLEKLNLEKSQEKINQYDDSGCAAAKGQYMYHMVEPELQE